MPTTEIVPHAKGTDILGAGVTYIVRSELGCYMRLSNELHEAKNGDNSPTIFPLHSTCSGGDHYLGYYHSPAIGADYPSFLIIKGDEYREVEDLTTDKNPKQHTLHPDCRGGDFYMATSYYNAFSTSAVFIIVYKAEGMFKVVSDLSTGKKSTPYEKDHEEYAKAEKKKLELHENCKGGLYYWATKSFWSGTMCYYLIKGVSQWGVQVHWTYDLHTDKGGHTEIVHPSVVSFLPGGQAANLGPTFGHWALVQTIDNSQGATTLKWKKAVSTAVGYRKGVQKQTELNWNITTEYTATVTAGLTVEKILEASCKEQFSLKTSFGGKYLDTRHEDWSEEKKVEESLEVEVSPKKSAYIWQYQLGMGEPKSGEILFTKHIKQVDSNTPPTNVPIPSVADDARTK